jgi:IS1 family transposase
MNETYLWTSMKSVRERRERIERKHLRLRMRIKRLTRKTVCFSLVTADARASDWAIY